MNLLGMGGECPGVAALGLDGTAESRLLTLEEGESVYAVDPAPDATEFAVGTRSGRIYVCSGGDCHLVGQNEADAAPPMPPVVGVMPEAVLSVCHMGGSRIAAASAGQAGAWRSDDAPRYTAFDTAGETVCALKLLAPDRLAGLTADGRLLIWESHDPAPCQLVGGGDPPPRCWGIVSLEFDACTGTLFWPARDGGLTWWRQGEPSARTLSAHSGGWYALCLSAGRLVTVGRDDSRLIVWDPRDIAPVTIAEAPGDTTAVSCHGPQTEDGLVLIDGTGMARIVRIEDADVTVRYALPSGNYRATRHVDWQCGQEGESAQQADVARGLATQITAALDSGNSRDVPRLHGELQALGYIHVSLALQAEEARRSSDPLRELRLRRELAETMGDAARLGSECLLRYADLLGGLWQIGPAAELVCTAETLWPDMASSASCSLLKAKGEAVARERCLVDPDVSFPMVAEASLIMKCQLPGRWIWQRYGPSTCSGVRLTPEDVHGELLRRQAGGTPSIEVTLAELAVVSQAAVGRCGLVLLSEATGTGTSAWELGLEVVQRDRGSTITPIAIFQPNLLPRDQWPGTAKGQGQGWPERKGAGDAPRVPEALGSLSRVAAEVLRRAVTRRSAQSRRTRAQ